MSSNILKYIIKIAFLCENMKKLDVKDKKILYHLDQDSRQSFAKIGRAVGLNKDVVAYRIKKLQEKGIIKHFCAFINDSKLGYHHIRFYITFQFINPDIKKEIINYFVNNDYLEFVHSSEGHYDLVLIVSTINIPEFFYNFWYKALKKYRKYFANIVFSYTTHNYLYPYSFLINEEKNRNNNEIKKMEYDRTKIVNIDNLDIQIIKTIGLNSRIPTIDIAKNLKITTNTVISRINNLLKIGVIQRFRIFLDFSKLGYRMFKIHVILNNYDHISKIINFIEKNPHLTDIDFNLGYADVEIVFILKNTDQLFQIVDDLSSKFPEMIKNYTYIGITESHKVSYLPELKINEK